jgi:alpha-1,2-mannosyltransferase
MNRAKKFALLIVGAAGFAASIAVYRLVFVANPGLWTHTDEWVYWAAGRVARHDPADLYLVRVGEPGSSQLPFTYPPFAAWIFGAVSGFSFRIWQIALVVLDMALLPVITSLSLRISGHRGRRAAGLALVLAAVSLWLEPVFSTMFFGQINLILLTLILADFALPDSCRWKGACTGIAAGIKLTPLIFIPYLLVTRRRRAGLVGLLTFAVTVAIGFADMPTAARQYWTTLFAGSGGAFHLVNQSINGVVQRLTHGQPPATIAWAASALVVATAGVAVAAIAHRRGQELLAVVLCGVTGLLVSPISWTHHWVWVIPALVLVTAGTRRPAQAGGGEVAQARIVRRSRIARTAGTAALLALFVEWPHSTHLRGAPTVLPHGVLRLAPYGANQEYTWRGATLLLGNAYVLAGLVTLLGTAGYLWVTRRRAQHRARGPAVPVPAAQPAPEPADRAVPVGGGRRR